MARYFGNDLLIPGYASHTLKPQRPSEITGDSYLNHGARGRSVRKVGPNGKVVRKYPSVQAAATMTGMHYYGIYTRIREGIVDDEGCRWEWGDDK